MIRAAITSLCFLVALASGLVAYLSLQSIETADRHSAPTSLTVHQVLDSEPSDLDRVELTHYQPGKYFASRDYDEDEKWELVCVPFFPKEWNSLDSNYASCIVCLEGIANRKQLAKLIDQDDIETTFLADRQVLPDDIHFRLAKKYQSMDFSQCRILYYGFEPPQPFLGVNSWHASIAVGILCVVLGIFNILFGMFADRIKKTKKSDFETNPETVNRAGLPAIGSDADTPVEAAPQTDSSEVGASEMDTPVDEEQSITGVPGIAALIAPKSSSDAWPAQAAEPATS